MIVSNLNKISISHCDYNRRASCDKMATSSDRRLRYPPIYWFVELFAIDINYLHLIGIGWGLIFHFMAGKFQSYILVPEEVGVNTIYVLMRLFFSFLGFSTVNKFFIAWNVLFEISFQASNLFHTSSQFFFFTSLSNK